VIDRYTFTGSVRLDRSTDTNLVVEGTTEDQDKTHPLFPRCPTSASPAPVARRSTRRMLSRAGESYTTRARSRSAAGLRPRTLATSSSKDPGQGRRSHAREQHRNTFGHDRVVTAPGFPLLGHGELLEPGALIVGAAKSRAHNFVRRHPRRCPRRDGLGARVAVVRGISGAGE